MTPFEQQREIYNAVMRGRYWGWRMPKGYGIPNPGATHIVELGLTMRTFRGLFKAGIFTVEDLMQYEAQDLLCIGGFGKKCLAEVEQKVSLKKPGYKPECRPQYKPELPSFRCGLA